MSLQLILGGSGSGKSHWLYTSVIQEAMQHPQKNYIVIVPEQFTMQTQRELVRLHPACGILNIDILSFQRLAYRVFEETGADQRTVLTETGKNLLLRRVAAGKEEELAVMGSRLKKPGYLSEIKSILSELAQYEISDSQLEEMIVLSAKKPQLQYKLKDIQVLYRGFLEYRKDRFLTAEELLDVFCQAAASSRILKNSELVFDGFTGFTPVQQNALKTLLTLVPEIKIAVTLGAGEMVGGHYQEHELFYLSKKTIHTLMELARQTGCEVKEPVILNGTPGRFKRGSELEQLEQRLFRYGKEEAWRKPAANSPGEASGAADMEAVGTGEEAGAADMEAVGAEEEAGAETEVSGTEPECATEQISLHTSRNPMEEVRFAARTISRLTKEKGYRYREIAVITGDLASYGNYVRKIFEEYEIPCFVDQTMQVLLNPSLEFIRGAFGIVDSNFSYESVFRFLRTGFAGLTKEETDRLENYVLALGIRGKNRWMMEWTGKTHHMEDEEPSVCEAYRRRVIGYLAPWLEVAALKNATLRQYAEALYDLLVSCNIQEQLELQGEAFQRDGRMDKAKEYEQIYETILGLLDEAVELLGDEPVTRKEFEEILEAGFSEARVGIIPPGIDQVHVGDMERTRLNHIRVLFFLGLNDGWIPVKEGKGGIVSELEREFLQESGVELAPTARENSYIQRFYLYLGLTKPEERLYLSYCRSSNDGKAMRPSYLVGMIRKIFPGLTVRDEDEAEGSIGQITSLKTGFPFLAEGLRKLREKEEIGETGSGEMRQAAEKNGGTAVQQAAEKNGDMAMQQVAEKNGNTAIQQAVEKNGDTAMQQAAEKNGNTAVQQAAEHSKNQTLELLCQYLSREEGREKAQELLDAAFLVLGEKGLERKTARELYGEVLENSVTRLEQFAACAFAHFASYGLDLREREEYTVRSVDIGNIFHRALELFSRKLERSSYDWFTIPEEIRAELMEQAVEETVADYGSQVFFDSARNNYMIQRIKRILRRSVWALHEQVKAGNFVPSNFEVAFQAAENLNAVNIALSDTEKMRLKGRIDRIDVCEEEDTVYVKVVDYKSGNTSFDLVSLYYGLQLQLVVYLNAALEMEKRLHPEKNIVPAGIFYYRMKDPLLEGGHEQTPEEINEAILKKLRLDGIVNEDPAVVERLDRGFVKSSSIIPVGKKADGSFTAASGVASDRQLRELSAFVQEKLETLGKGILKGEIGVRPYRKKQGKACDYCMFADLCGFDPRMPGASYRELKDIPEKEVWKRMEQEQEKKE